MVSGLVSWLLGGSIRGRVGWFVSWSVSGSVGWVVSWSKRWAFGWCIRWTHHGTAAGTDSLACAIHTCVDKMMSTSSARVAACLNASIGIFSSDHSVTQPPRDRSVTIIGEIEGSNHTTRIEENGLSAISTTRRKRIVHPSTDGSKHFVVFIVHVSKIRSTDTITIVRSAFQHRSDVETDGRSGSGLMSWFIGRSMSGFVGWRNCGGVGW